MNPNSLSLIGGKSRKVTPLSIATKTNPKTRKEIILYDSTPGGSGFVKDGLNNWGVIIEKMQAICWGCSCEKSCYDCLKNYTNQSYHEDLDRHRVNEYFKV